MRYLYNPPLIMKKIFNDFIWETSNNKILLTFDDGPNPGTTELILNELNNQKLKAAFFCVGNNISLNRQLAKDILTNGHLIANHTYNHKVITKLSESDAKKEIEMFNEIAGDIPGLIPQYFRPPHGRFNLKTGNLIKEYKLKNVMWSLLTYDHKNDPQIVKHAVKKYLRKNSIVVLHDSLKSKSIITDSIKIIVEETYIKGFEFGEPEECLK